MKICTPRIQISECELGQSKLLNGGFQFEFKINKDRFSELNVIIASEHSPQFQPIVFSLDHRQQIYDVVEFPLPFNTLNSLMNLTKVQIIKSLRELFGVSLGLLNAKLIAERFIENYSKIIDAYDDFIFYYNNIDDGAIIMPEVAAPMFRYRKFCCFYFETHSEKILHSIFYNPVTGYCFFIMNRR